MITEEQARELIGRDLTTENGEKIGRIGQIFLDDETGRPEWVTVHTGLFGTSESFVPLADASVSDAGCTVPYDKSRIKDAPNIDVDAGHLSREEEGQLYEYYGLSYSQSNSDSLYAEGNQSGTDWQTTGTQDAGFSNTGTVGYDTSGPTTDDAMTRSEERLNVGTQSVETGRARLRKYIVTENVTTTVPVSREEVRIEREPITAANMGNAMAGPDLSEEEHEVVLHAERPVIDKEVTPVERVRLDKETVVENTTVQDSVRKEEIEMVDDTNTTTDGFNR